MKKIIGGRRYDTATAKLVGTYETGYIGDFDWRNEKLYMKSTGEFFLAGKGGARTRWASRTIDGFSSGDGILPLTLDEAREWAEEHLSVKEVENLFRIPSDAETGKKIQSFSLSQTAIAGLKRLAQTCQTSRSDIIEQLVSKALKESQNA
jgi:hypothetical protein